MSVEASFIPYAITKCVVGKCAEVPFGEVLMVAMSPVETMWDQTLCVWVRHEVNDTRKMTITVAPDTGDIPYPGPHFREHVGSVLLDGRGYHAFKVIA